jgi:Cu/Ag efflux pump CusA
MEAQKLVSVSIPYEDSSVVDYSGQIAELQEQVATMIVYVMIGAAVLFAVLVYLFYRIRLLEVDAVQKQKSTHGIDLGEM